MLYSGPFRLSETTTVTVKAIRRGMMEDYITRATFTFAQLRSAEDPTPTLAGLECRYYEGEWLKLPDFADLAPAHTCSTGTFILIPQARAEHMGVVYKGLVRVPQDGVYTFYTVSDDGSRLYIGDVLVVDNDGPHGQRERSGEIALQAGFHIIQVSYFQSAGESHLSVSYEGPGVEKQEIPATALSHVETGSAP